MGVVDPLVDRVVTDPRSRIPWELNPRLACDHPGCPPRPELVCHPPLPSDPAQTLVAGASWMLAYDTGTLPGALLDLNPLNLTIRDRHAYPQKRNPW